MWEEIVYEKVDAITSAIGAASTQIAEASVRHSWSSGRSRAGPPGPSPGLPWVGTRSCARVALWFRGWTPQGCASPNICSLVSSENYTSSNSHVLSYPCKELLFSPPLFLFSVQEFQNSRILIRMPLCTCSFPFTGKSDIFFFLQWKGADGEEWYDYGGRMRAAMAEKPAIIPSTTINPTPCPCGAMFFAKAKRPNRQSCCF